MAQYPLARRVETAVFNLRGYQSREHYLASANQKSNPANLSAVMWPAMIDGQPMWRLVDLQSYIEEGFSANEIIYETIMFKVRSIKDAPMRAFTGDKARPELADDSHPLAVLMDRPNPDMSGLEFFSQQIMNLNIAGNAYTLVIRDRKQETPTALWPLRPDWIWPIPRNGEIVAYLYFPYRNPNHDDAFTIDKKDMIHVRLPNPNDPLSGSGEGLSPIAPLARSGSVDNQITKFLHIFFERGTNVGAVLKYPGKLDDKQVARVKGHYREMYGGVDNWATEPMVIDSGGEYIPLHRNFEELGFEGIDFRNETRIIGPFGVPPILVGSRVGLERSTFSNYAEARRSFWEDTFKYEIQLFQVDFQYHLQSPDGAFVMFDLSNVPALQRNVAELATAYSTLVQYGIPIEIAAQRTGLEIPELPHGKMAFLSAALVPILDEDGELVEEEEPIALPAPGAAPGSEPAQGEAGAESEAEEAQDDLAKSNGNKRKKKLRIVSHHYPTKRPKPIA